MLKVSYQKLLGKKNNIPITCLTAYSKPTANILDGKVDLILIGDSLGTTLYGMKNTRGVTLDMMKHHGKAVVKNTKSSMTIIDMPYKTYSNKKEALNNANELISFTKADFVKIEIDNKNVDIVKYLSDILLIFIVSSPSLKAINLTSLYNLECNIPSLFKKNISTNCL